MTDDEVWICRAAILRIANMRNGEDRRAALEKYNEPLRGVIARGLEKVMPLKFERWRREAEERAKRTAKKQEQ